MAYARPTEHSVPASGWGSLLIDPTLVKHYEIVSRLGEGGMGVVYRARDTRLGRVVALKMLPAELARDAERAQRFEREARIVSSLSHPGIATLFDFDREDDMAFLTMELVEGPTLREVLEDGPLPVERLLECGVQIAEALAAAHEHGIVHRDLKPENIMVAKSGYYKVLDFGVARIEDETPIGPAGTQTPTRTWATRAGTLLGTVAYMSPEQIQGQPADPRSDIFALGSVIHELATGVSPFARNSDVATAHAIAYEKPQPESRPDLPPGLELVLRKCLSKKPDERYSSAVELAADLRTLRQASLSGSKSVRHLQAYRPFASRRRLAWLLALPLLVALVALALLAPRWLPRAAPDRLPVASPAPPRELAVPAAAAHQGPPRVIVAFFENNTGDSDAEWVSKGLPEMLTTDLSHSQTLEVIATQRLHDLLATAGYDRKSTLDRSTTAELARWAGADIVISGSVFKLGEQYRIDAQAYDIRTGTVAAAHKVEGTELFRMVEGLTTGLIQGLGAERVDRPALQALTTSEDAFRAFNDGQGLSANLRYDEAADRFRESIALDADFALPRLHLATSLFSAGEIEQGLPELRQALAQAESMPAREQLLAHALDAYYGEGDFEKGSALFAELVEKFPRHAEAYVWWGRAQAELEQNPLKAMRHLRAAHKIDRDFLPAVIGLAGELDKLGAAEDAEELLRQTAERYPAAREPIQILLDSD